MTTNEDIFLSSPLFAMSLTDRELFHSNFLWWIASNYPSQFSTMLNSLGIDEFEVSNIYREKNHFDFCIIPGAGPAMILENKIKSIPSALQLMRYDEVINGVNDKSPHGKRTIYNRNGAPVRVLLTMITKFPDLKAIKDLGWKIVSYKDYAESLREIKPSILYHKLLIEDYANFVTALYDLINTKWLHDGWLDEPLFPASKPEECAEAERLRISDLYGKTRFSAFCEELRKEINKTSWGMETPQPNVSYTTRGGAIVDVYIPAGNVQVGIQIQNGQYRYVITTPGNMEDLTNYAERNFSSFLSPDNFSQDSLSVLEPSFKINPRGSKDEWHQFNKTKFIYKYRKIKATASANQLIPIIIDSLKEIERMLSISAKHD